MKRLLATVAFASCVTSSIRAQDVPVGDAVSLAQAIDRGLAREPAVRAAKADIEIARGTRLQAGLRPNLTISVERQEEPGGTDASTDVGFAWPLELFRRGPRIAVANAEVTIAEYEEADARRQLAADVASAYGDVAAALRGLAIADDVIAGSATQLELLRARAAQGATPTLDRDILDVELQRMQAERLVQAGRADRALVRLKRLLGMSPDAELRVSQSLEELAASGGEATSIARPDVQASEARVSAEEHRIAAARQEGRPDVTLFGSYMRMDAGFPQRGFSADGAPERVRGQFNYVAAGAMITVPLWNRQQGKVTAAVAARDAAAARAEAARLTAASEIAEARLWNEQTRRTVSLYEGGIRPLARRNLETVRETYQLGRATVFDVLAEQRRYLDTERAYTEALTDAFQSRVSLSRATGGIR